MTKNIELKPSDYRLLSYLYHNTREALTKIAKVAKLSREQVDYRISKYLKEGIIRKFVPVVNYPRIGYKHFILLLVKFSRYSDINLFKQKH